VSTPARELCGPVLAAALVRALEDLAKRFGPDISQWRWGDAHIARFRNRVLSPLPLIGGFADIAIATDGDTFTLNRGTTRRFSRGNFFAHGHGATFRAIYDFADLERARFIQPTGQSGNPLSSHYRDLIETWRDGGYLKIPSRLHDGLRRLRLVPTAPAPPREQ
ncbi:MAG: penicillin acylase family protein, partial [Alphaproteobacteria bacterium]